MIVLDANYFLRAIVQPQTPQDRTMAAAAQTLFRLAATSQETFTTNEAIVAEVVFALGPKGQYRLSPADVAVRLKQVLSLPGCKLPHKRNVLRALDLWVATPTISFVDALTAIQALSRNQPLATFDRRLARVPGVTLWQPPAPPTGGSKTSNGTT